MVKKIYSTRSANIKKVSQGNTLGANLPIEICGSNSTSIFVSFLKPYFYPGFPNAEESLGNHALEKTGLLNEVTTKESLDETLEGNEATKASEASPINAEANEDIQNLITIRQPIFIVSTSGLSQVTVC